MSPTLTACQQCGAMGWVQPCSECGGDEDAVAEAEREHLLEMLEDAGEDGYDLPVDLNPEGDPTRNGAF